MGDVIVGIDPDSHRITAIVTAGNVSTVRRKTLPANVPNARKLDVAWMWVYRLVRKYESQGQDVHIGIESPFIHPKRPSAAIPLTRLNGAMLAAAQHGGAASVHEVTISTWKKDVVGNGSASKPQIELWCKVYWQQMYDNAMQLTKAEGRQDVCDAAAINRHVLNLVKRMKSIEKHYAEHSDER